MTIYAYDILSGKLSAYTSGSLNNSIDSTSAPTPADNSYTEGQIWVDTNTNTPYILVDVTAGVATWTNIGGGGGPVPDASETVKGILELATQAETDAGTDDLRAVTPLKLQNKAGLQTLDTRVISANDTLVSGDQVIADTAGTIQLALPAASAV